MPAAPEPRRTKTGRTSGSAGWSGEDDAWLIARYGQDATLAELSFELDRSPSSIDTRIRALRGQGFALPERKPRWTDMQKIRLARRYREGAARSELAAEFGKAEGTIGRQLASLRAAGTDLTRARVPIRRRGPGRTTI